jgi:DNA-binding CsgD family transcriptional regulator
MNGKKQDDPGEPRRPGAHFEPLVPGEVVEAYLKLLTNGRIPKEAAAEFIGDAALVEELGKWGMADFMPHTASSPPSFRAVPPHIALMAVLGIWHARIAHQVGLVFDGYQHLIEMQAIPAMDPNLVPDQMVEVLRDPDEIVMRSRAFISLARRDFMTLETADSAGPMTDDFLVTGPPELCAQLKMRSIYDTRLAEHPSGPDWIASCVQDGEEARVMRDVPMKMKLADQIAVMMPTCTDGTTGALVITAPPICRTAYVLFNLLWQQATPFGTLLSDGPLNKREQRICQLLVTGAPYEAVAKKLSCSTKTVSRDIQSVEEKLGLNNPSPFQLGYALGSRSWLSGPIRPANGEIRNA